MILFVAILFLAVMLRVSFLSTSSSDDMVHLWNTQLRARKANLSGHEPDDSVLEGNRGYPALSHFIISRFPKRCWRLAGKFLNIAYDLLLMVATGVVAAVVLPSSNAPVRPELVAMAVMATSPLLLPINSRVKSMGARILGNVFVFGYILCLWYALQGNVLLGLAGMFFFGVATFLTSKFALQFVVFTAPFLALFCWSWLPLLGLFLIGLSVLILPGLGLRDVFSFMMAHSRWYANNHHTVSSVSARNNLRDWLNLPHVFRVDKGVFWATLFRRSSYFIALYSFPVVLAVLLLRPSLPVMGSGFGVSEFGAAVVAATACLFFATSLRPLLFLGQAERYLEYCLPMASILFALAYSNGVITPATTVAILCFQTAMSLANLTYSHYAAVRYSLRPSDSDENFAFMDQLKGRRILAIPVKLGFQLSFEGRQDNSYYYRSINMPGNGFKYLEEDLAWFEMPHPDFGYFKDRYGIDTVVLDKQFFPLAAERGIVYPVDQYETLFENDRYLVIKLDKGQPHSS